MGNRVSISFTNGKSESVALFSHWGGKEFVQLARQYVKELQAEARVKGDTEPLYRLEPGTVMVDFVRAITALSPGVTGRRPRCPSRGRVESDLYFGEMRDPMYGDNSDNGHHIIHLLAEGPVTLVGEEP